MNHDTILASMEAELEKIADWGLNLGRTWGRSSTKAGWSTKFRSAGMQNPKPPSKVVQALPGSAGKSKSLGAMPKPVAETNNQVTLRRNLSNIETPEPE